MTNEKRMGDLLPVLSGEREGDRVQAIVTVSKIARKDAAAASPALPFVLAALGEKDSALRKAAAWAVGQYAVSATSMVADTLPALTRLLSDNDAGVRGNTLGALGRIGRGDKSLAAEILPQMQPLAEDPDPKVRMHFLWGVDMIAGKWPSLFEENGWIDTLISLLCDPDEYYVRREAPEIFRSLGIKNRGLVEPAIKKLEELSYDDVDRDVRKSAAAVLKTLNPEKYKSKRKKK